MRVAFDCDGTLIGYDGKLRDDMCRLLIAFLQTPAEVIVWSGGGKDYANSIWRRVIQEYYLLDGMSDLVEKVECKFKDSSKPDLTFDDMRVTLGAINVCIPQATEQY